MQSDRPDNADDQPTDPANPQGTAAEAPAREPLPGEDLGQDLPQMLADAQAKATENYDLFLRAVADLENARRRAQDDVARRTSLQSRVSPKGCCRCVTVSRWR